ncbi:DNA methylase [Peribacillus asahii]|uniref:DNA methylase n=1 Tax=Peribacillus asahii TaxID=228899 RepID=A0A398BF83_9BACI|nr:DNA methyltransferase [Peribacillus asahii]RID89029.1 DNA methylase [Peribacillus asahii]
MSKDTEQLSFVNENTQADNQPVVCLGMTFKNDDERREYFRNELRKKLPELKEIEGFPIGNDEDIIALSDPPYYTVCPNPWNNEFLKLWKNDNFGNEQDVARKPYTADISEGKRDPIYIAHSYHTKVPHKAIMRYILHYTKPGDVVLDGFAGTGMTAIAANLCGNQKEVNSLGYQVNQDLQVIDEEGKVISKLGNRKAIINDLSPQASFISYNFNSPTDTHLFEQEALSIIKSVEERYKWAYQTYHIDSETNSKKLCKVNYYVWSDVFECPNCANEVVFWEAASDSETGKVKKAFSCPSCNVELTKNKMERIKETIYDQLLEKVVEQSKQVLVLVNYSFGKKKFFKKPDDYDIEVLQKITEMQFHNWVPTIGLPDGYNTKQPINSHGFTNVHHFYSLRNLHILSELYNRFKKSSLENPLLLLFSSQLINISKLNRFRPEVSFPYNPLNGTLYIGSQVSESNVFDAYYNKLKRFVDAYKIQSRSTVISCSSTTDLELEENSVDYIFTDPPFGANIMYSELSFIWESWLKVRTNNNTEAIINSTQRKGLPEYQDLVEKCFSNYYKALKPGRWITVEFSNSQASVWNAIQEAIQRAGFVIANVSVLDKQQGSFKAVTSTTAVKQDLVISAYKPREENVQKMKHEANTEASAWTFVMQHLEQLPVFIGQKGEATIIAERTPRILFDRMVAYHVQNGLPVPISSPEFQVGVAQRFPMRDGMAFLENQVAEYDKKRILVKEFAQMSLFVSDETSAIEWIRQQLMKKTQTRQDLHPAFMKEIQHIAKHEMLPELDDLLYQNFLRYDGDASVPDQIASYLRKNYKDLRGLDNDDSTLKDKALNRWYVPDPNKQADLEKLREKSLLREFEGYIEELEKSKKKLKQFRTEAVRAGFKKAWSDKDYQKIVTVGERLPESVIQEDDKLLMYYDNAQIRLGL